MKTDFLADKPKNICGTRIRELRKKYDGRGITQVALAAKIQLKGGNLDRLAVSRVERRKREVSDRELVWFAAALKTDVGFLVCGNMTAGETAEKMMDDREPVSFVAEDD